VRIWGGEEGLGLGLARCHATGCCCCTALSPRLLLYACAHPTHSTLHISCPPNLSPPLLCCCSPEIAQIKGAVLPIARNATAVTFGSLAEARSAAPGGIVDGSGKAVYTNVFETLRKERANARLVGIREKKAKEAAAKDAAAQKKAGKAGGGEGEE
jgi:hypothetical protein